MSSRSRLPLLGGFALLGALTVWQFLQIRELKDANAALRKQAAAVAAPAPVAAVQGTEGREGQEGGKGGDRRNNREEASGDLAKNEAAGGGRARFRQGMELDRRQRNAAKILALTTKLQLTTEQQAMVKAALENGDAARSAVWETMRGRGRGTTDETRQADAQTMEAADKAQEQAIASGLSAEQLAAYTDYKAEQARTNVENQANRQLGVLQSRFSLTEDQKDAAFQFFARQEEDNPMEPSRLLAGSRDYGTVIGQRRQEELETMKQILTPEQYELYRTQEEERTSTFRNAVPEPGEPTWSRPQPGAAGIPSGPPPPPPP